MRFLYLIPVEDSYVNCYCCKPSNRWICIVCGLFQMVIVALSLSQHIYSIIEYRNIFLCRTNISDYSTTPWNEIFLSFDIIIFDFGLFHYLLGTSECVANYLDGGYMRCLWCFSHVGSFVIMYAVLFSPKHQRMSWLLVPCLLNQSIYSLGLVILILATIPKMISAISRNMSQELLERLIWYMAGSLFTWFFTCVLWHYYWMIDDAETARRKARREQQAAERVAEAQERCGDIWQEDVNANSDWKNFGRRKFGVTGVNNVKFEQAPEEGEPYANEACDETEEQVEETEYSLEPNTARTQMTELSALGYQMSSMPLQQGYQFAYYPQFVQQQQQLYATPIYVYQHHSFNNAYGTPVQAQHVTNYPQNYLQWYYNTNAVNSQYTQTHYPDTIQRA